MSYPQEIERKLSNLISQQVTLSDSMLQELMEIQSSNSKIVKEMRLMNMYLAVMSNSSVDKEDIE